MTEADIPAGMRLKELAGWNQTASEWRRFLRASPAGCFVVELDGRVCGTATTIVYEGRFAWIGMVLVDPECRGRGIGTRLLAKAIEHLDAARVPTLKLDATPEGRPIYAKLGFVSEYEIERWALERRPDLAGDGGSVAPRAAAEPAEQSASLPFASQPDVEGIVEFDREVFGADRGGLLKSLDDETTSFTLEAKNRGQLQGYALGRRGSRADHLGPWIARDESSARGLLVEFLRRSKRETIFVDCVKLNRFACGLAQSLGFEFSRPLTRMYRGPNHHPGRPEFVCGILGPEFG
jgi:GNAT superfamily N-acetyltransferase